MFQRGSWTVKGAGSESAQIENKNKRLNLEQLLRFVVTTVSLLCPLSDILLPVMRPGSLFEVSAKAVVERAYLNA